MDDYKYSDSDEEKNAIFRTFCASIWANKNKRRVCTKSIRFSVRKDLVNTEIGQVFNTWSEMKYKGYKARTSETDWCSLIRQKINNLYTRYFDKEVILNHDYLNQLRTPKRLYYQWADGAKMTSRELTTIINRAIDEAGMLKITYQQQKMELSWNDYKRIIEGFLRKIMDNCKLIEDFEDNLKYRSLYDFINEDNFYISYFCKSLEAYMQNYVKSYFGLKRGRNKKYKHCKECGSLIEATGNKKMYCDACAKERKRISNLISNRKYKNAARENRNSQFSSNLSRK